MLLVDYRQGSIDLLAPLRKIGLPAEQGDIPADLAWEGRGERGVPTMVGVEYKKLNELVQSMRTERLQGHQMLKMRDHFQFNYLLIEGDLLYDRSGLLQEWRRRKGKRELVPMPGSMTANELLKRLFVLQLCGGLTPLWARTLPDTLKIIEALYRTWTDTDLDQHKSHIAIYQPPLLVPISEFRKMFKGIDDVGVKITKAIETHFRGSVRRACMADRADWLAIEGIGPRLATHIDDVLEGRKH